MAGTIEMLNPEQPKRVLNIVSNKAKSDMTGWDIGAWAAEMTHPYYEFTEHGYEVDIITPNGGDIYWDGYGDPRDASGYSAHDLISMGFINTPSLAALLENTKSLDDVKIEDYDALMLSGGQGPMYTFYNDERLHQFVADFYEAGKVVCIICHATCVLLKVRLADGSLLVDGKTWTGFANVEEDYADEAAGVTIQPFRIEDEAQQMPNTNFITAGLFKPFAIRDGRLITGQQQYAGANAARLVIQALGQ